MTMQDEDWRQDRETTDTHQVLYKSPHYEILAKRKPLLKKAHVKSEPKFAERHV